LLAALLGPIAAGAEDLIAGDGGMEARVFRAAVDTKGHFTVDGTDILPHLDLSLGLMLDFGFHTWPAVERAGDVYEQTRMKSYINGSLLVNLGLFDLIVVGAQLPVGFTSGTAFDGFDGTGAPRTVGWSTKGGLGDLAAHVKLRWLRADKHPVGVGTVLQYQAPLGQPAVLMGEPGGALSGKLVVDAEPISWYRAAVNVGARFPFGAEGANVMRAELGAWAAGADPADRVLFRYGPSMTFGLGQSFSVWPGVTDLVVEIYGSHLMSELAGAAYLSVETGVGAKVYLERNSYLMVGYGHGLPLAGTGSGYGFQGAEHRLFLGFAYEPSMGDRDEDGIKDDVDQCPDVPEDFDEFDDSDGCLDEDNDRDGIPDVEDECPLAPEDKDGDQDDDGCPERDPPDRDGDGIVDGSDDCPDEPEDQDGFEDSEGCPDPDNDGDRIPDTEDDCPNEPEDADRWDDSDGCPDPDNDGDRIPDVDDDCDNIREVYNGHEDEDGCPDEWIINPSDTTIELLEKIYFQYDSAVVEERSYDVLDAVAAFIRGNPQIDLIEVQGHADDRGREKYNLDLTTDRAASVVTHLIQRGVDPARLRSMGYGEYCPIARGRSKAARDENRRVEFKVIVTDGKPTGVEVACDRAIEKGVIPPTP
jgi:outer membrane protein OmpA-like peptidoglycan-associated protein